MGWGRQGPGEGDGVGLEDSLEQLAGEWVVGWEGSGSRPRCACPWVATRR